MPAHRNGGDAPACAGDLRAPIQDGTPEGRYQTEQLFHQYKRSEFRRGLRSGHRQTQQSAVVYAGQDRLAIKIPSVADFKAISAAKRARDIHFDSFLQIPVVDDNIRASRFVLIWQRRDLQTSGTTGLSPYQMAVSIIPGMA